MKETIQNTMIQIEQLNQQICFACLEINTFNGISVIACMLISMRNWLLIM